MSEEVRDYCLHYDPQTKECISRMQDVPDVKCEEEPYDSKHCQGQCKSLDQRARVFLSRPGISDIMFS